MRGSCCDDKKTRDKHSFLTVHGCPQISAQRFGSGARRRRVALKPIVSALLALAPIAGATLLVSDRENGEGVIFPLIRYKVWKPVNQNPASFRPSRRTSRRIFVQKADGAFDLGGE